MRGGEEERSPLRMGWRGVVNAAALLFGAEHVCDEGTVLGDGFGDGVLHCIRYVSPKMLDRATIGARMRG